MTTMELEASQVKVERGKKLLAERHSLKELYNRLERSNAIMLVALSSGFEIVTYAAAGSLKWDEARLFLGFEFPESLSFDVKTELVALRNKLLKAVSERMQAIDEEFKSF